MDLLTHYNTFIRINTFLCVEDHMCHSPGINILVLLHFLLAGRDKEFMDSVVQPGDYTQEVVRDTK